MVATSIFCQSDNKILNFEIFVTPLIKSGILTLTHSVASIILVTKVQWSRLQVQIDTGQDYKSIDFE